MKMVARSRNSQGIVELDLEGEGSHHFHLAGAHMPGQLVRLGGHLYLASEIVARFPGLDLTANTLANRFGGVKYGPGGRRLYLTVTAKLVDDLEKAAEWPSRSDRERQVRKAQVDLKTLLDGSLGG